MYIYTSIMDMPLIQPVAILDEFGNLETCCTCFDQFENTSGVRTSSFLGFRQQGAANTPFENEFPSVRMYLLIQTAKGNEINEMDEKKQWNLTYQSRNSILKRSATGLSGLSPRMSHLPRLVSKMLTKEVDSRPHSAEVGGGVRVHPTQQESDERLMNKRWKNV